MIKHESNPCYITPCHRICFNHSRTWLRIELRYGLKIVMCLGWFVSGTIVYQWQCSSFPPSSVLMTLFRASFERLLAKFRQCCLIRSRFKFVLAISLRNALPRKYWRLVFDLFEPMTSSSIRRVPVLNLFPIVLRRREGLVRIVVKTFSSSVSRRVLGIALGNFFYLHMAREECWIPSVKKETQIFKIALVYHWAALAENNITNNK